METKINQLQEELGNRPSRNKKTGENIPTAPAIHEMSGHRDNITAVKFHPVFSLVVSASLGRNLKSHFYLQTLLSRYGILKPENLKELSKDTRMLFNLSILITLETTWVCFLDEFRLFSL